MMRMTMMLAGTIGLCSTAAPAAADSANLHTFHCLHGCPLSAPANDDLIVREIYTLASNPITKWADWVAYRVTPHNRDIRPQAHRQAVKLVERDTASH